MMMNFTARVRPSPLEESYVGKVMLLKTFEQGTPYRFSYEFDRDLECNDDEQWFISIRNVYFSPSVRKDPAHLPFLLYREAGQEEWKSGLEAADPYSYERYASPHFNKVTDLAPNKNKASDLAEDVVMVKEQGHPSHPSRVMFTMTVKQGYEYDISQVYLIACGIDVNDRAFHSKMKRVDHRTTSLGQRCRFIPKETTTVGSREKYVVDIRHLSVGHVELRCAEVEPPPIGQRLNWEPTSSARPRTSTDTSIYLPARSVRTRSSSVGQATSFASAGVRARREL